MVGHFGRRGFMEDVAAGTERPIESVVFAESFTFHEARATAVVVFMEINVTVAAGEAVVLLIAVVFMLVTTATSSHALESVAIPALSAAEGLIVGSQVSGGRAMHDGVWHREAMDLDGLESGVAMM